MRARVLLLPIIIFLLIGSVVAQDEPASKVIPEKIMSTELKPLRGTKPIKLSDYGDKKVLVLAMWATWCGPCRFSMPELNRIRRDFSSRGVEVIGLSNVSNEPSLAAGVRHYVRVQRLKFWFFWITEETSSVLNTRKVLPVTLVVTSDGVITKEFLGWNPTETAPRLRAAIEETLARKAFGNTVRERW